MKRSWGLLPFGWLAGACALVALAGPAVPVRAAEAVPLPRFDVQPVRDLAYYEGADADPVKHRLDLFLPKDQKDFPVVFFVHGGSWRHGDKGFLGIYSSLGMCFARHGIGAVVTSYRLSPKVRHPEHARDVARAFAWTYKNIARYGGRPDQIFVCGHSAGAHLISLLALDETYLKAEGLAPKAIRGAIAISGVYTIPERLFASVFGKDPVVRKQAAPIEHVKAGAPPFLILYAEKDYPTIDRMSEDFCRRLREEQCIARICTIEKRNHMSIIVNAGVDDDPAAQEMLGFVRRLTGK